MKKSLLIVSALIAGFSSYAQYEGFENWTQNNALTLDDYETAVNDRGIEGTAACYPSTDAVTGIKSLKLETVVSPTNGDTIFGYFISGDPDNMTPGQAIPLSAPGAVDSIIGWYKYDIQAGDSALILLETFVLGNPTGGGTYYFKGQQLTWKRFAYPAGALGSDSILIAAATGDPINNFNGIPGTWIQLDDIQLKGTGGTGNILNYSFENWSTISWEEPNNWQTGNMWAFGQPSMPAVKSTDKYAGNFALELTNLLGTQPGDTLRGVATNGMFANNGLIGGQPYVGSPTSVECYYKYAPVNSDNSSFNIEFRQNGSIVGNYGTNFPPTSTYAYWSQPISAITPDTVLISIWSGNQIGSVLKIDNIDFVFPVGIAEGLTVEKLVAYPNPVIDELKIRFNIENNTKVNINLVDINGKILTSRFLGNLSAGTYRETFNASNYSAGIYFIEFTLNDEKVVHKFVIK